MCAKPFETKIQDLVYNVDVGLGLMLVKSFLYVIFVVGMLLLYSATQFNGFRGPEAMENSQLARNVAKHNKMVTQTVRPLSIWFLKKNNKANETIIDVHPDLIHPPAYPAALGFWFRVLRTSFPSKWDGTVYGPEKIVNFFNQFLTIISGFFVYLLGRRLFERRVAMLTVTMFFLSNLILADAISGLAIPLATLFTTAMIFFAVSVITTQEEEGTGKGWVLPYLLSVACLIGAFLTRYGTVALVPGLLLFYGIGFRKRGWMFSGVTLVLFLIGITPWLVRNMAVSGSPLGLAPYMALEGTKVYEAFSLASSYKPTFDPKVIKPALFAKWVGHVQAFCTNGHNAFGSGILTCLFVSTFFYRFVRFRVHLLRWAIALSLVTLVVIAGFFGDGTFRLMHIFWPVIILYATAFFFLLLDRLQIKAKIFSMMLTTLMVVICSLPTIFTLMPPRADIPNPPYVAPLVSHVSHLLEPDELMCSDMPWATAWYGNRQSLLLPVSLVEFYEINDYNKKISGIYFTLLTRDLPYLSGLRGPYKYWFPILEGQLPPDFPLTQGFFPLTTAEQVFLTDRTRWQ